MKVPDPIRPLRREAVRVLRRIPTLHDGELTEATKRMAEIIVDIRSHFDTDNGRTDWRGRSYLYRQEIADIYAEAGVPPGDAPRIRQAIAYHVSNVLRERLDDATLKEYGLRSESARTRSRLQRAERTDLVHLARGSSRADAVQALHVTLTILRKIDPLALPNLAEKDRRDAAAAAREIEQLSRSLSRALAPRAK